MPEQHEQNVGDIQAVKYEHKKRGEKSSVSGLGEHKPYIIIELDRVQAPNGEVANAASIEFGGGLVESATRVNEMNYGTAVKSPAEGVSDEEYADFLQSHTELALVVAALEQTAAVLRETQNIPKN